MMNGVKPLPQRIISSLTTRIQPAIILVSAWDVCEPIPIEAALARCSLFLMVSPRFRFQDSDRLFLVSLHRRFLDDERGRLGRAVERRCYSERKDEIPVIAMAGTEPEENRNVKIAHTGHDDVFHRVALVFMLNASGHFAKKKATHRGEFPCLFQMSEHSIDLIRPSVIILDEQDRIGRIELIVGGETVRE
jgi:hypothetical protein